MRARRSGKLALTGDARACASSECFSLPSFAPGCENDQNNYAVCAGLREPSKITVRPPRGHARPSVGPFDDRSSGCFSKYIESVSHRKSDLKGGEKGGGRAVKRR